MKPVAFAGVVSVLVASCADPGPRPSIWAEYMPLERVSAALPMLSAEGFDVGLAVPEPKGGLAPVLGVIREAERNDVGVRLWPLLSEDAGYWANQDDAREFSDFATRLMDQTIVEGLKTRVIVVDLETHYRRFERIRRLASSTTADSFDVLGVLVEGLDETKFEIARAVFRDLIERAHQRGFEVHLTTAALLLDDAADGDESLAKVMGTPLDGVPWDRVSFQVYRTLLPMFAEPILMEQEIRFSPYVVYSFCRTIVERYGDRAAVDLGLIAGGSFDDPSGYVDPRELARDVEAALAAGVRRDRLQIYALDGLVEQSEASRWLSELPSGGVAPPDDGVTERFRKRLRDVDATF